MKRGFRTKKMIRVSSEKLDSKIDYQKSLEIASQELGISEKKAKEVIRKYRRASIISDIAVVSKYNLDYEQAEIIIQCAKDWAFVRMILGPQTTEIMGNISKVNHFKEALEEYLAITGYRQKEAEG